MLMTESAESNVLTFVKLWSTWVITSKTSPTITNDPLNRVNTHPWSKLGQRVGQNPGQTPMSLNFIQNFCRVLQISPKHIRISKYKSCPVFLGSQLCFWVAFQIWSGKWWKTWSTAPDYYSPASRNIQSLPAVYAKSIAQNPYEPFQKL
jgi:hypothetical protein